jgi:hypothetical protein
VSGPPSILTETVVLVLTAVVCFKKWSTNPYVPPSFGKQFAIAMDPPLAETDLIDVAEKHRKIETTANTAILKRKT